MVGLVIRMLSACWRSVPSSSCRSFRSLAEISPKIVGKFLSHWGRAVQQYCCSCCVFGSCHSKAKMPCDSGANRIQKKASFKSNTEHQVLEDGRVTGKV